MLAGEISCKLYPRMPWLCRLCKEVVCFPPILVLPNKFKCAGTVIDTLATDREWIPAVEIFAGTIWEKAGCDFDEFVSLLIEVLLEEYLHLVVRAEEGWSEYVGRYGSEEPPVRKLVEVMAGNR